MGLLGLVLIVIGGCLLLVVEAPRRALAVVTSRSRRRTR
jgi:hypothetical protein